MADAVKLTTLAQAQEIANAVIDKVRDKGYAVEADLGALAFKDDVAKADLAQALADEIDAKLDSADLLSYTIKKQQTAETGYAATYQLFSVDQSDPAVETAVGAKINIPKDMVVTAGEVKTVTQADVPYSGAVVGDKYIDLTIANATNDHIYIPVKDLVDIYTAGNGLSLNAGEFAVVVDGTNANGLSVGANGLALAPVVASASGVGGSNGAMTAAQAEKLAGLDNYTEGNGIDITNRSVSVEIDNLNARGLSVGANGVALAAVVTSVNGTGGTDGAMLATDKEKLDSLTIATTQEVNAVIAALDAL